MVAHFLRLKLTLLGNTFRRSIWQTIGVSIALLYALGMVGFAVVGAVAGGWHEPALTGQVLTVVGAVLMLSWWALPVFFFGTDATLDPQRFVTYAIPRRSLVAGLTVAGLVSVPGIATVLAVGGVAFAWLRSPAALVVALVGAVVAVALCVVGSRAATTLAAPLVESRRSREFLTIIAFLLLMALSPAFNVAAQALSDTTVDGAQVRRLLDDVVAVVGWTPLGAPWAMASAAHEGQWLGVVARLLVALAGLAVLTALWAWALRRNLERPPSRSRAAEKAKGLGLFGRLPATPTGAVAARSATYWLRDPRYGVNLVAFLALPVIMGVAAHGAQDAGGSTLVVIVGPIVAWLLGFTMANDVAYDDSAFALHLATGTPGIADRWGRTIPVLVVGLPMSVAFTVVGVWLADRWDWLVPLLGFAVSTLLLSLGIAAAMSARWLYPVPKPGQSPFATPQGSKMAMIVGQAIGFGLTFALSIPGLVLTVLALTLGGDAGTVLGWVTLVVAPALGVLVLWFGIRWGARIMDRRGPDVLQQILAFQ